MAVSLQAGSDRCPSCDRLLPTDLDDLARTRTFVVGHDGEVRSSTPPTDSAAPELAPGTRFGHFEIVEPLGRGGMGAVYRALDTSLQRYVALKVIRQFGDGSSSGERRSRLKQEAIAQARLNHPHVVTIYFVDEQDGHPFFAMELVPGRSLAEATRSGPLEFFPLVELAVDTTSALLHAEHSGIVHGDIKPGNLLLDANGHVKLGDFGLARFLSDREQQEGLSGTLDYMAPELLSGGRVSFQSDMYALGATLHELSYGKPLAQPGSRTLPQRLEAQKTRTWQFPEDDQRFPEAWHAILRRLLEPDPQDRYESYEHVLRDLATIRPRSNVAAGRTARLLAYMFDSFLMSLLILIFALPLGLVTVLEWRGTDTPAVLGVLARGLIVLGPLIFAWIEGEVRKTPGRYLLQLQVVDHHGLRPKRRTRYVRHFLRMMPTWFVAVETLYPVTLTSWLHGAATIFMLINGVTVMFMRSGTSLVDWFCGTSVVLDHPAPKSER
ncbi:MAG: protein kinase [Planctomycetales bacterium]|nr:protein kinase [Planctomycetales bacterium]